MNQNYQVSHEDLRLSDSGVKNIALAEQNMKGLLELSKGLERSKIFDGLVIGMALHVTKETAVLVKCLQRAGAEVAIASCNPLSTQDDVAQALAKHGVNVYAKKGETKEEYYEYLKAVLSHKPNIVIDDGCDLISILHEGKDGEYKDIFANVIGGCEETTTGVIRLRSMEKDDALKFPVIAVNDNKTKHLLDNYYGTGQSTLDGLIRATNTMIAGKTVVVAGYGSCGKGVSLRAKGLGANVIITEVDPFRALQAVMDGFRVMPMIEACKVGDIFLTVTGDIDVITYQHISRMKSGAIIANSGHFDCEIDIAGISAEADKIEDTRPFMKKYTFNKDTSTEWDVYILADGRLVNLSAAEGHPSEVMSTSFMGQMMACKYIVENKGVLTPKVHTLPEEFDVEISKIQLISMGIYIDKLTEKQEKYLNSWNHGT